MGAGRTVLGREKAVDSPRAKEFMKYRVCEPHACSSHQALSPRPMVGPFDISGQARHFPAFFGAIPPSSFFCVLISDWNFLTPQFLSFVPAPSRGSVIGREIYLEAISSRKTSKLGTDCLLAVQ